MTTITLKEAIILSHLSQYPATTSRELLIGRLGAEAKMLVNATPNTAKKRACRVGIILDV